jgi:DNA replication protein DnaC
MDTYSRLPYSITSDIELPESLIASSPLRYVNELVEAKQERRLAYLLRQLKRVGLLILDKLAYITFDLAGAGLLFQLLATRYEAASTMITLNIMSSEWMKIFHDKALTAALLD